MNLLYDIKRCNLGQQYQKGVDGAGVAAEIMLAIELSWYQFKLNFSKFGKPAVIPMATTKKISC